MAEAEAGHEGMPSGGGGEGAGQEWRDGQETIAEVVGLLARAVAALHRSPVRKCWPDDVAYNAIHPLDHQLHEAQATACLLAVKVLADRHGEWGLTPAVRADAEAMGVPAQMLDAIEEHLDGVN